MNPVLDNIKNRRSIRKYNDKAVSQKVIRQLIEAGRYAPSSHNSQPWRFVVVSDKKKVQELSSDIKKWYKRLLILRPILSFTGLRKLIESVKKRVESDKDLLFYDAPLLVLICAKPSSFALVDSACAAQNMMLSARSLNIGSCWIGFADTAFKSKRLREKAGVPDGLKVMASLVFGYPLKFPDAYPRDKEAKVVKWVK